MSPEGLPCGVSLTVILRLLRTANARGDWTLASRSDTSVRWPSCTVRPANFPSKVVNRMGSGDASGRRGFDLDSTDKSNGPPMAPISNRSTLLAAPLGSTWNCLSIRSGALTFPRVSSEISSCPPTVKDSIRPARFTLEPTAAYFVRRNEPMLPTITRPVCTPDAHLELRSALRDETLVDVSHGELHGQSTRDSLVGIVIAGHRRAKDHEDGVADDLIDGALVAVDDIHHRLEIQVENFDHLVRGQPCGHGGEAAQVGHQDGGLPF